VERAYAIAGIAVGLAVILISVDLLTGGRLSAAIAGSVSPAAEADPDE
jgi:hypothetical protein